MMKGRIVVLFILLASSVSALDSDWGGKLENISQTSNISDDEFTQGNKATLWYRGVQSPLLNFYLKGGYTFRYEKEESNHIYDLTNAYVYGRTTLEEGQSLSYTAGRFRFNDSTGRVMKSLADGVEVQVQNRTLPLRFGAGYTGLVFSQASEISMSPADKVEKDDEFLLATPRLIGFAEAKYPNLPGGNRLTLAVIAQQDLRSDDNSYLEDSQTGKLHSQYFQLGADGRIIPDLYYGMTGVLQTGQYLIPAYDPIESADYSYLGGMAKFTLDYYLEARYKTTLSMEALYSSGDSWSNRGDFGGLLLPGDKTLNHFTPISNSTKGFVYTPKIGNLVYTDLHVSVKPLETLQVVLTGITFMRAVDGPVSDETITEDSGGSLYLGQEVDLVLNYRPYSDLGLSLTSGVFFPNADLQSEDDILYRIGAYVSVSF